MPLKTTQDDQLQLNLTPMIDVLFLLIIFFMVATKFTELERVLDVDLPQVSAAGNQTPPPGPLTITIHADGKLALDGQPVGEQHLVDQLAVARQMNPDLAVMLEGDGNCAFKYVTKALSACRKAEVYHIDIAVELATSLADRGKVVK